MEDQAIIEAGAGERREQAAIIKFYGRRGIFEPDSIKFYEILDSFRESGIKFCYGTG